MPIIVCSISVLAVSLQRVIYLDAVDLMNTKSIQDKYYKGWNKVIYGEGGKKEQGILCSVSTCVRETVPH